MLTIQKIWYLLTGFFQIVLDYLQTVDMTLGEFFNKYGYTYDNFQVLQEMIVKDFELFEMV